MVLTLSGCVKPIVINSKGPIGQKEIELVRDALLLMLIVVIPVIVMTFTFAWKFRESNKRANYSPKFYHNNIIELVVWFIPIMIILVLATLTWRTTHELDPYKPIASEDHAKPITIEAVALDWKWLFIYPEQGIATINYIMFPVNVPVAFKITADAPMNALQIPQLGTQIYAMAGMQTQLHLIAYESGNYIGRSVNFSGQGFADMVFSANAVSNDAFNSWLDYVRQSPNKLDGDTYNKLAQPSEDAPVEFFSSVQPHLFQNIMMKFMMPGMDDLNQDHSKMMPM
ncbi:MAG: ubiquinol oxidase subunit II [Burkholderiales bacterium]|nr:ubiquinol oxidase subunit II [Burkholderiales bacterium]